MAIVLSFFKKFVLKYLTTVVIEKLMIVSLKELVKRSDSKFDDELYETVFGRIQ
ncbi:MAG: hypothetical protein ACRCX2_27490 [Paraclostridium sp.]